MTPIIVAVAFLAVVLIVATVGLCMAAKRGDRALGYEQSWRRCSWRNGMFRCRLPAGHDGPHEVP